MNSGRQVICDPLWQDDVRGQSEYDFEALMSDCSYKKWFDVRLYCLSLMNFAEKECVLSTFRIRGLSMMRAARDPPEFCINIIFSKKIY